jgi:hypothetical protein
MNRTFFVMITRDGFTDERSLVIKINTPLDENKGSAGKHSFALVQTALGKYIPKKPEAHARILELLRPHFVEAGLVSADGWIEASLNSALNMSL